MVRHVLGCGLALVVAAGVPFACGGGEAAHSEAPTTSDASPYASGFFGDADARCKSDSDCPAGQVCRTVRVGELSSQMCVVDPTAPADASRPPFDASMFDAPFDAGIVVTDFDSSAPTDAAGLFSDTGVDSGICNKALKVLGLTSGPIPSCYFKTDVTATSAAELTYECAGGAAAVTFGTETFTGTVQGTTVDVTNVITYDFQAYSTKCNITSTQTITGDLASGTVQYSLKQALSPAQPAVCSVILLMCYENGTMSVQ